MNPGVLHCPQGRLPFCTSQGSCFFSWDIVLTFASEGAAAGSWASMPLLRLPFQQPAFSEILQRRAPFLWQPRMLLRDAFSSSPPRHPASELVDRDRVRPLPGETLKLASSGPLPKAMEVPPELLRGMSQGVCVGEPVWFPAISAMVFFTKRGQGYLRK